MATDKGYHQTEENPHQGFAVAGSAADVRKESAGEHSEQERAIRTERDDTRSTGVNRRPSIGAERDLWRDGNSALAEWSPQVEAFRRDGKLVVRADLPGLKKEDVKVEVDGGLLTISGERRDERKEERDNFYRSERTYGQFYRAIPLPDGIDDAQCDASFQDGVLEVTFPAPKAEDRKAKRIPVK